MVSSAHPLATQAGIAVLARGGNAFDDAGQRERVGSDVAALRVRRVGNHLGVEETIPAAVRDSRAAMGHQIRTATAFGDAHGLTIEYDSRGRPVRFRGGADPRGEGVATGFAAR